MIAITFHLLQLLRLNESNPLASVNVGATHKSYQLLWDFCYSTGNKARRGEMCVCQHNPQHLYLLISKIQEVRKTLVFPHKGWSHLRNVRPPHRSVRSLDSLKAWAIPWRIENITQRNFLFQPQCNCVFPTRHSHTSPPTLTTCLTAHRVFSVYCKVCLLSLFKSESIQSEPSHNVGLFKKADTSTDFFLNSLPIWWMANIFY